MQVAHQKLFYRDKEMKKNSRTLGSYKVENDRTIVLKYTGPALPATRPKSLPASAFEAKVPVAPKVAHTAPKPVPANVTAGSAVTFLIKTSDAATTTVAAAAAAASVPKTAAHASHSQSQNTNSVVSEPAQNAHRSSQPSHIHSHIAALVDVPDGTTMPASEKFVAKEEANFMIEFAVQCANKPVKLKMAANDDIWAVKLKLEALKYGKAGNMTVCDESGEELDDEGTLDELGVNADTVLVLDLAE
eukprot:c9796_g1_i3.p1 GENE.c9796_g1_i3~~c9796_g1_i3.p1  ORF type:complete len:246 (+),score=85.44 c9796_g1_i3:110-847(+)